MKTSPLFPLTLLAAILAFSLWNGAVMRAHTDRWQAQLWHCDALAQSEHWPETTAALAESYQDWSRRQTYLHILSDHDAVDDAETMYQRALAFAAVRELSEFRAELADLRAQLRLLAEMEQISIENVL